MDVQCGVRVNGESDHDREIPVAECLINFFYLNPLNTLMDIIPHFANMHLHISHV